MDEMGKPTLDEDGRRDTDIRQKGHDNVHEERGDKHVSQKENQLETIARYEVGTSRKQRRGGSGTLGTAVCGGGSCTRRALLTAGACEWACRRD